jgi:threonylcarbamoyladenosine tRNA methylthiotransferase MtaB
MPNQVDERIKKERVKRLIEISKKLEIEYADKFIDKELYFIPETYKEGYLIGHTGNYLLVKALGDSNQLHMNTKVKILATDYPYSIGKII